MDSKTSTFNDQWLNSLLFPEFTGWLSKGTDKYHAFCNVCKLSFDLGNLGCQTLLYHVKEPVHVKLTKIELCSFNNFSHNSETYQKPTREENGSQTNLGKERMTDIAKSKSSLRKDSKPSYIRQVNIPTVVRSVESLCLKHDITSAEVKWTLSLLCNNMSAHSCVELGELFKSMFPDSAIASEFQMDKSKCSYIINHGLGPYFDNCLRNRLKGCNDIVICFDESDNKTVDKIQIDLFIRFFDNSRKNICTEYFNSIFLTEAKVSTILNSFNSGIQSLAKKHILQVSIDRSDMNFSFLKKLEIDIKNKCIEGRALIDIGVCSLHMFSDAIRAGLKAVKWDLHYFLQNVYCICNDSPAFRAEFISFIGKDVFSIKQEVVSKSLEYVSIVERTLLIFDDLQKFLKYKESLHKGPLENIHNQMSDKFVKCKLAFFKTLLIECEHFLEKYQTSKPLSPFLFSDVQNLVRGLLSRFVQSSKLTATSNLLSINFHDTENLCDVKHIDIGNQAEKFLQDVSSDEHVVRAFKLECQKVLIAVAEKIIRKCPLKFKAVQGLSSLDPNLIFHHPELGILRFKCIIEVLCINNRITEHVANRAKCQYALLCNEAHNLYRKDFEAYEQQNYNIRLDDFYSDLLSYKKSSKYSELHKVIKLCLLFSHSNASAESGYSVNKDFMVENMQEVSVVAQMKVFNALKYFGGVKNVPITDKIISYVTNALKYYQDNLKRSKCFKENELRKEKTFKKI